MAKKTHERVGHGIFSWNGQERRTDRYGSFIVDAQNHEQGARAAAYLDLKALKNLVGKRVRVWCVVVETRTSGHIGDLFHGIKPSTPNVGEVVDLGVGTLQLEDAGFNNLTAITLHPKDGRKTFWIDPRRFYRLHDQTVDVFVEATDAEFSPKPNLEAADDSESIDTGDNIQVKGSKPGHIAPDVERLGDGMFVMTPPGGKPGRRRKIDRS